MDAVNEALTSQLTTVSTGALDMIVDTLPLIIPIIGAMVVIGIAFKTFKKAKSA